MKRADKIISVKEMRKLLGKDYSDASNSEVETIIVQLELMADIAIKQIKRDLLVPKST